MNYGCIESLDEGLCIRFAKLTKKVHSTKAMISFFEFDTNTRYGKNKEASPPGVTPLPS